MEAIHKGKAEEFKLQAMLAGRELESKEETVPVSRSVKEHGQRIASEMEAKKKKILEARENGRT